jgi:hypothetical protein
MTNNVSDKLLATFDNIEDRGKDLPIEELKKRFAESKYFKIRDYKIYNTVITIPVSIDLVTGQQNSAVNKILEGLRELHGDQLMFVFNGHGENVSLEVRMWRDEEALRATWREYAEDEYKSAIHGQAAANAA